MMLNNYAYAFALDTEVSFTVPLTKVTEVRYAADYRTGFGQSNAAILIDLIDFTSVHWMVLNCRC